MAETGPHEWSGVRVVELADGDAQVCGRLFADAGADVIKIEAPAGWRPNGRWRFGSDDPDPNRGHAFWHQTRRKRSLSLNLDTELGRHLFRRLIATTDVLIESFPPDFLSRLHCGFTDLAALNPRLVYLALTPFGQRGADQDDLPRDLVARGFGGWLKLDAEDSDACGRERIFDPDVWDRAGRLAYLRAGAALLEREVTDRGAFLDISLQDALVLGDTCPVLHRAAEQGAVQGIVESPHPLTSLDSPGWLFRCRDGGQIFAPLVRPGPEVWSHFVAWLEAYDLAGPLAAQPERHLTWIESNLGLIYRVIQRFCRHLTTEEVLRGARTIGLEWQAMPDSADDSRGSLRTWTPAGWLPHSSLVLGTPPLWPARGHLPTRGEHTTEILVNDLGCDPASLADLAADSVI